jgi:hypothetical protein
MKRVLSVMFASTLVSAAVYFDAPLKTIKGWVHQAGTEFEAPELLKFFQLDWNSRRSFGPPRCFGSCPEREWSL